jgi:general secretion pathway protein I
MMPTRPHPAPGEAGFTLLEAIVAIAVLLAALVPLYALVSNVSQSAFRVDQANHRAEIETDALNIMAVVNPMEKPEGLVDLGAYSVHWSANAVAGPLDGSAYPTGISAFRVGLFDAKVDVSDPSGRLLVSFPLRMVGYKHVRDSFFK